MHLQCINISKIMKVSAKIEELCEASLRRGGFPRVLQFNPFEQLVLDQVLPMQKLLFKTSAIDSARQT